MDCIIQDEIFIPNRLSDIDERLLTYESIISFQKEEIIKTEALILEFQNCLKRQQKALQMFFEERERLVTQKKTNILYERELEDISSNVQIKDFQQPIEAEPSRVLKRKNSCKVSSPRLCKRPSMDSNVSDNSTKRTALLDLKNDSTNNIKKLDIPQMRKETVRSMISYDNELFIGGSRGLLLRYTASGTNAYDTKSTNVILQLEIMKHKDKTSLIAFTKGQIIIFEDIDNQKLHRKIILPSIGCIYNDGYLIYVPLGEGVIQKLNGTDLRLAHFATLKNGDVSGYIPGFENNKCSLITFKDSLLYKAKKTSTRLQNVEVIEGVTNVKRIKRIGVTNFLYYSDDTITFMNSDLQNNGVLTFKAGIKLVEVCATSLAVVEDNDCLHIYEVDEHDCNVTSLKKQRIVAGSVTALSISLDNVFISVGSDVFMIDYKK